MENNFCTTVIQHLLYYLKGWTDVRPLGDGCMVVTPFQHYDQSFIELYVEFRDGKYIISDDGETLAMLFVSGLTIDKRSPLFDVIEHIARFHDILFEQDVLSVSTTEETLGEKVYALIHAIQSVGFLIYCRSHRKRPTFKDEVETLILKTEVIYTPDYTIHGKANTHKIDFYINSGRELLIDTLSAITVSLARSKVKNCAYKHLDLNAGDVRHQFALVLDDRKVEHLKSWQDEEIQSTFNTYFEHTIFFWSTGQEELINMIKR